MSRPQQPFLVPGKALRARAAGGGPPEPEILNRLAAIYRRLEPDLLCLQEVQDGAAFRLVSESVKMPGSWCPGGQRAELQPAAPAIAS